MFLEKVSTNFAYNHNPRWQPKHEKFNLGLYAIMNKAILKTWKGTTNLTEPKLFMNDHYIIV